MCRECTGLSTDSEPAPISVDRNWTGLMTDCSPTHLPHRFEYRWSTQPQWPMSQPLCFMLWAVTPPAARTNLIRTAISHCTSVGLIGICSVNWFNSNSKLIHHPSTHRWLLWHNTSLMCRSLLYRPSSYSVQQGSCTLINVIDCSVNTNTLAVMLPSLCGHLKSSYVSPYVPSCFRVTPFFDRKEGTRY